MQYISNIFVDTYKEIPKIKKKSENLALCGNIGIPNNYKYYEFIKYHSKLFDNVYIIPGRIEYFNFEKINMIDIDNTIRNICNNFDNVYFLNCDKVHICDNMYICGTTLWYNNIYDTNSYDNRYIYVDGEPIRDEYIIKLYNKQKKWLKSQIINYQDCNLIFLTHFAPSHKLSTNNLNLYKSWMYSDKGRNVANCEELFISPPLISWLFGSTNNKYNDIINDIYFGINSYNSEISDMIN
jgi:hypothetical protein